MTGSSKLGLHEAHEASSIIQRIADPEANIIFGAVLNEEMGEMVKITVIATGFRAVRPTAGRTAMPEPVKSGAEAGTAVHATSAPWKYESPPVVSPPSLETETPARKQRYALPENRPAEPPKVRQSVEDPDPGDLEKPAYLRRRARSD